MKTYKNDYRQAFELKNNVKAIFNAIDCKAVSKNLFEYTCIASAIMDIVENGCDGFVVDICKRFNDATRSYSYIMSDKQRWCVAFAFNKMSDEQVENIISKFEIED